MYWYLSINGRFCGFVWIKSRKKLVCFVELYYLCTRICKNVIVLTAWQRVFGSFKTKDDEVFKHAEIAQLVEHNLAKVGVAGPSPVFRSSLKYCNTGRRKASRWRKAILNAQVAELVDAHVSGACAARRAGSSPVLGTCFSRVKALLLLENNSWRGGGIGRRATLRG